MTTKPPTPPRGWKQTNTNGGTGFQGGEHHHHYGSRIGDPVTAAADASAAGVVAGSPITCWDPLKLGVHTSITTGTGGPGGLPRYVVRDHDQQLRDNLGGLVARGESGLVMLVGDSCTGKTRALYEAVTDPTVGLRDRAVYQPDTQDFLVDRLRAGLPGPVIVWLDELQRFLDHHDRGATVARALHALLTGPPDQVGGPILVVATLWTTSLATLTTEPRTDASGTAAAANLVRALLTGPHARRVPVAPDFTGADPTRLSEAAADDPRIQAALNAAGDPARVTQVLAGGANILARLHPDDPDLQAATADPGPPFHPPAQAVIYAAGELRRIGWGDDPIPRAILRGVTTGYLDGPRHHGWFERGLAEATHDADQDQEQNLNIHTHGIPALTALENPINPEADPLYQLHDYLAQDHQHRQRHTPTRETLWTTLTAHTPTLTPAQTDYLTLQAWRRGLLTHAITLTRTAAGTGSRFALLTDLLADRGTPDDETELRGRADTGDQRARNRLAQLLAFRGTPQDLAELHARAATGDRFAVDQLVLGPLAHLIARRATPDDITELHALINKGDAAAEWVARLMARRFTSDDITELHARVKKGVPWNASRWVVRLLPVWDATGYTEIYTLADNGRWSISQQFARRLAKRVAQGATPENLAQLRGRANCGDVYASYRLVELLAERGTPDDETELREHVQAGFGGMELLTLYRAHSTAPQIRELDCNADPVYDE